MTFAFSARADESVSNHDRLSLLSDGKFTRQIELPTSVPLEPNTPLMEKALATYSKLPFDVGERIQYKITYMGIKGGTAELLVRTPVKWEDTWAHRFTGEVLSASWVSWFIVLHDSLECLTEGNTDFVPVRFYINQSEGSFQQSKLLHFSTKDKKIRQETRREGREPKTDEFEFLRAQDAIGAIYYLRSRLASGVYKDEFQFPIFTSEKTWDAKGKLLKQESLKVEGNSYETDLYELHTQLGSSLQQKGKFRVWFTRDSRRLPVLIEADVKFGSVKVALSEWDQGYADPKNKSIYGRIRSK